MWTAQGSVLDPLLFLIYVNDIGNVGLKVPVRLFADDTNLFIVGKNVSDVEKQSVHSMSLLSGWFVSNKLSLNLAKTCYMSFFSEANTSNNIILNNCSIEKVQTCKYLGITIDMNLSGFHTLKIFTKN